MYKSTTRYLLLFFLLTSGTLRPGVFAQTPGGISGATAWFRADMGVTGPNPVTQWDNHVVNTQLPSLSPLPQNSSSFIEQISNRGKPFNFHNFLSFSNSALARELSGATGVLTTGTGTMIAVGTSADFVVCMAEHVASGPVCGGGRCATGPRWNGSTFVNLALYAPQSSHKRNVANLMGMRTDINAAVKHENTLNGFRATGNASERRAVAYRFAIGSFPGHYYNGGIAEVICFPQQVTEEEFRKLESYLAVKYGITLGSSQFPVDYLSTAGTIIWQGSSTYQHHITGIGRDDLTGLYQKQSHSVDSSAFLTLFNGHTGGIFPAMNADNISLFDTDRSFLITGDNNGDTSLSHCTNGDHMRRMDRVWQVQRTGSLTGITLAFRDLPAHNAVRNLLISPDPAFAGTPVVVPLLQGSGFKYAETEIPHNHYFTFASDSIQASVSVNRNPVCVQDTLQLDITAPAGSTYQWTGPNTFTSGAASIQLTPVVQAHGGRYTVAVTLSGCTIRLDTSVTILPLPSFTWSMDTSVCGDSIRIRPDGVFQSPVFTWHTGMHTPDHIATARERVWLLVTDGICSFSDTVTAVPERVYLDVDLGNDTTLCSTEIPFLLTPATAATVLAYSWQDGSTDRAHAVAGDGTYWVEVSDGHCTGSDTITIRFTDPPVWELAGDTTLCPGDSLRIGIELPGAEYLWQDGLRTPYRSVAAAGRYLLTVRTGVCAVTDSIQISLENVPDIALGPDLDLCEGQELTLRAGTASSPYSYQWNTGATTPEIRISDAGIYSVRLTSPRGCSTYDSILVSSYPMPEVSLPQDTTVCEETPLTITAVYKNTDELVWSDGHTGAGVAVTRGGEYTVTASNKCGTAADTILIQNIFCDIWLPNSFTPDGDGINDVFRVLGNTGRIRDASLSVYNRWGERIFHSADLARGWDGSHRGNPAPSGTYVYMLSYRIAGKPGMMKGSLHLIR